MEQNLEKIFLEKDSGADTHAYPLWTQLGISRKFLREDMARKCIYPTTGQTRVPSRLANHVFKSRSVTVVPAQLTSGMTSGLTAGVTPPWPSRGQPRRAQERLRSD